MSLREMVTVPPNGTGLPGVACGLLASPWGSSSISPDMLDDTRATAGRPAPPSGDPTILADEAKIRSFFSSAHARGAHDRGVLELDEHPELVELAVAEHLDLELVDRGEPAHDLLDRRREEVDATDDQHVVEPAEDPALEDRK